MENCYYLNLINTMTLYNKTNQRFSPSPLSILSTGKKRTVNYRKKYSVYYKKEYIYLYIYSSYIHSTIKKSLKTIRCFIANVINDLTTDPKPNKTKNPSHWDFPTFTDFSKDTHCTNNSVKNKGDQ